MQARFCYRHRRNKYGVIFIENKPMPVIRLQTFIEAPIEEVYDLARSVEMHMASTAQTRERAIAGRTTGLCEEGDRITWEATHFGIRQQLTVAITRMQRPLYFEDHMVKGAFKSFRHQHFFESREDGTLMSDIFEYRAPLGVLGRLADTLFLKKYMNQLLCTRNDLIKKYAETKRY